MNGIWGHFDLPFYVVHHGVMAQGRLAADYYTSQPDLSHWIAVGLAASLDMGRPGQRRMLVGQGCTEDEAIHALWVRIAEWSGGSQLTVSPESSFQREDKEITSPMTCARIYLAAGDRLTVPDAAFVREDPTNGSIICSDANGSPIKAFEKHQVIGYLVFTRHSDECSEGSL